MQFDLKKVKICCDQEGKFSPHKTTLMLVIRDQTKTPLEKLESVLREDIRKFEAPGCLVGNKRGVVPSSEFSSSAQKIWNAIKENKNLDLPVHKGVKAKGQPIKVMSNLKNIDDLKLENKVDLMKDSIFYSLSSVTNGRESSGTLVAALCKYYDHNKRGFQLNNKTYFSFFTKEVAKTIRKEDKGINYLEYVSQNSQSSKQMKDLRAKFASGDGAITAKQMNEILTKMTVDDDESKQQFRRLMTIYLIEQVLLFNRNNKVLSSLWWLVINLDACESVKWAKATEEHLNRSMMEAQTWLEKSDSVQHSLIGAAPVLKAILYERIPGMLPNQWTDESPPIQKWKPHRRDENQWIECRRQEERLVVMRSYINRRGESETNMGGRRSLTELCDDGLHDLQSYSLFLSQFSHTTIKKMYEEVIRVV
ncbi:hypothetical protein L1987_82024 [Smallanthus sonchifolius]|uniref:Uncharacterized protein n=1 Tax=Smallanthus sonchifolius TaxID=185202 RepID=A0ACB8YSP0_9ASTR|nr:hypothetical protein L1987_82024 [Smallanthus sonchifolius]